MSLRKIFLQFVLVLINFAAQMSYAVEIEDKDSSFLVCYSINRHSGKTSWQWAINPFYANNYLELSGKFYRQGQKTFFKVNDIVNKQLVREICQYTLRFYEPEQYQHLHVSNMYVANHFYSANIPMVFNEEAVYPEDLESNWYEDLPIEKQRFSQLQKYLLTATIISSAIALEYFAPGSLSQLQEKLMPYLQSSSFFFLAYEVLTAESLKEAHEKMKIFDQQMQMRLKSEAVKKSLSEARNASAARLVVPPKHIEKTQNARADSHDFDDNQSEFLDIVRRQIIENPNSSDGK